MKLEPQGPEVTQPGYLGKIVFWGKYLQKDQKRLRVGFLTLVLSENGLKRKYLRSFNAETARLWKFWFLI